MELYDLNTNIRELWKLYESGEIDYDTYKDTIESFGTEKIIEEHIKIIRNAEANISKISEEVNTLRQKADSENRKAELAKKLIINCLDALQVKKFNTGIFKVTKSISKSADITNISLISETYLKPQPPKVNKKAILDDLKFGKEINGARLKESAYIRIS